VRRLKQVRSTDPAARIVRVLFGEEAPWQQAQQAAAPLSAESGDGALFNASLDASQAEAVRFALSSQDVALIHGPPGTGKTTAASDGGGAVLCTHAALGPRSRDAPPVSPSPRNLEEGRVLVVCGGTRVV